MMGSKEGKVLAEMKGEKYLWYPDIHEQEKMLEEKRRLEGTSPGIRVTIYSLEGPAHLEDYNNWKAALTSKAKAFKRAGFTFDDGNIRSLKPAGYIVFIRS